MTTSAVLPRPGRGVGGRTNELALFAGAGGGILGGVLLGWRTVCAVENDAYARRVLLARQDDESLEPFPVWDDVRTFNGHPWHGLVDVITGGFPCTDISAAGRGAGIEGEQSKLWKEMARIVGEVRPWYVLVENSPVLTARGLGVVLGDLAALGYDAKWGVLGAADAIWALGPASADHERYRIWILAISNADAQVELERRQRQSRGGEEAGHVSGSLPDANGSRCNERGGSQRVIDRGIESPNGGHTMADADSLREPQPQGCESEGWGWSVNGSKNRDDWWSAEPDMGRVAHGVASRVDRLRCLGNGQVPAVVALAWRLLSVR